MPKYKATFELTNWPVGSIFVPSRPKQTLRLREKEYKETEFEASDDDKANYIAKVQAAYLCRPPGYQKCRIISIKEGDREVTLE